MSTSSAMPGCVATLVYLLAHFAAGRLINDPAHHGCFPSRIPSHKAREHFTTVPTISVSVDCTTRRS